MTKITPPQRAIVDEAAHIWKLSEARLKSEGLRVISEEWRRIKVRHI